VFKDVSFEVNSGEIFGVIGFNGVGKFIFFNVIVGVVLLVLGYVWFGDVDLVGLLVYEVIVWGVVKIL